MNKSKKGNYVIGIPILTIWGICIAGIIMFNLSNTTTTTTSIPIVNEPIVIEVPIPIPVPIIVPIFPVNKKIVAEPLPNVDPTELHCLALNIYHESANQTVLGKIAVAHVVINRTKIGRPRFRKSVCDVIYQGKSWTTEQGKEIIIKHKCQMSWYCDGKSDEVKLTNDKGQIIKANVRAWEQSNEIAFGVITGQLPDPTHQADHYYNPKIVRKKPHWADVYELVAVVDGHNFHRM